jgi:paraquat-inducible protein B
VRDPEVAIREIPTLPTTLEQVQQRASEVINELSRLDLHHLVESLTGTLDGVNQLVTSPHLKAAIDGLDETVRHADEALVSVRSFSDGLRGDVQPVAASLRATSEQASATLDGVRTLISPGSPLAYQLGTTLRDLGEAARALAVLADELERNPSVLVRGRPLVGDHR